MTDVANRAMLKDPTLFYGIERYVSSNNLTTENACHFHKANEMWGIVFRVKMKESIHNIQLDVEINRVPVNAAVGLGVFKWMVVRDYTCYIMHTQLGLPHAIEMRSC